MKFLSSIAFMLLLTTVFVSGQQVIHLWGSHSPAPTKSPLKGPETLPDESGRISNITDPTITVFLPPKEQSTGKAVLICPGGGYWLLTTYNEGSFFAKYLAERGVAAIVLKHRMPGGVHQIPLQDAERAMDLVVENAASWAIDTAKIGVMGFSAGGHLASVVSTLGARKPAFTILFYPVISMRKGITHEGSRLHLMGEKPLREYYSSELNVDKDTPPTLIFHSSDDRAVNIANSYLYKDALLRNGVPCDMVVYPTGGHGWGFSSSVSHHDIMKSKLIGWIDGI